MFSPWYIGKMENLVTYPPADGPTADLELREIVQQKDEKIACLNAEVEKLNLLVAWFKRQKGKDHGKQQDGRDGRPLETE